MNPSLVPTNHTRKARNETKTWINYQAHRSVGGSREAPSAPSANQSLTPPSREHRSDDPKLGINVRGSGAGVFINFAEAPPHRPPADQHK